MALPVSLAEHNLVSGAGFEPARVLRPTGLQPVRFSRAHAPTRCQRSLAEEVVVETTDPVTRSLRLSGTLPTPTGVLFRAALITTNTNVIGMNDPRGRYN